MDIGALTGTLSIEDQATSALDRVEKQVWEFVKSWDSAFATTILSAAAVTAAIAGIAVSIEQLGVRGSDINDVTATLEQFAGGAVNATAIIDKMRTGVLGTVDDFELAKDASRLLAANVQLSAEQFGTLTEAAFVLQNRGLGTTKEMLDLVSNAMITGRTKTLAMKLGVVDVKDSTLEYAKSLGVEVSQLTAAEAAEGKRLGIMKMFDDAVKNAGVQQRDFGEKLEFARATLANWYDSLASAVAKSPDVMNALSAIGEALGKVFNASSQGLMNAILEGINGFARGVTAAVPYVVSFGSAMVTLAKVTMDFFGWLMPALEVLAVGFVTYKASLIAVQVYTAAASIATSAYAVVMAVLAEESIGFGAAMTAALGPIGLVAVAVMAVYAGLKYFDLIDPIIAALSDAFTMLKGALSAVADSAAFGLIKDIGRWIAAEVTIQIVELGKEFKSLGQFMSDTLPSIENVKTALKNVIPPELIIAFKMLGLGAEVWLAQMQDSSTGVMERMKRVADSAEIEASRVKTSGKDIALDAAKSMTDLQKAMAEVGSAAGNVTNATQIVVATVRKSTDEQKAYNAAVLEYNSVGDKYETVLAKVGNTMYEGVAADLARGVSTGALAKIYKTTEDVIKSIQSSEKAWAADKALFSKVKELEGGLGGLEKAIGKVEDKEIEWMKTQVRTADALKLVEQGLPRITAGFGTMTQAMFDGVGKISTELDQLNLALKNISTDPVVREMEAMGFKSRVSLEKMAADAERVYKLMAEQGLAVWTGGEINAARDAWIAANTRAFGSITENIDQFTGTLSGMSDMFVKLAQIGGDSFGGIARDIGNVIVVAEEVAKAISTTIKAFDKLQAAMGVSGIGGANKKGTGPDDMGADAAGGLGAATGTAALAAMTTSTLAIALAWVQVGFAIGNMIVAIKQANAEAERLKNIKDWNTQLMVQMDQTTRFTEGLSSALMDVYGRLQAMEVFGSTFNDWDIYLLSISLKLPEIIRELGGAAKLTGEVLKEVQDRVQGLFTLIELGGPLGRDAVKILDDTLMDLSATVLDAGGMVDDFFLKMVKQADEAGIKLERVNDLMKKFGLSALTGFNAVVAGMQPVFDSWTQLRLDVEAATKAVDEFSMPSRMASAIVDVDELDAAYGRLGLTLDENTRKALGLNNTMLEGSAQAQKDIAAALGGLTATTAITANRGPGTVQYEKGTDVLAPSSAASDLTTQQKTALDLYARLQEQIQAVGGTSKDALVPMQGYLAAAAEASIRLGVPLDANIQMLIAQSREVGVWKNDFVDAMLAGTNAGAGLATALERQRAAAAAAGPGLAALGTQAVSSFGAAVASGTPFYEALQEISPALTQLQQAYVDLGIPINDAATAGLFMANTMLTNNPALIAGAQGLGDQMTALFNMGQLNIDTFLSMQVTGYDMFVQLQGAADAAGGTTRDALLPMQGWLQDAVEAAERLGFPLDANTQRMVDQSKELGLWADRGKTAAQSQTEMFQGILSVLIAIGDAMSAKIPAALRTLSTAAVNSAGVIEDGLEPVTDALTGNEGISGQSAQAADDMVQELGDGSEDAQRAISEQMGLAVESLTGTAAGSLTSEAETAANQLKLQIQTAAGAALTDNTGSLSAAAIEAGGTLEEEVGGAAEALERQLQQADWTSWSEEVISAARDAKAAIDEVMNRPPTTTQNPPPGGASGGESSFTTTAYEPSVSTTPNGMGSATTVEFNINALDSQSVDEWLRKGGAQKITTAIVPVLPYEVQRVVGR